VLPSHSTVAFNSAAMSMLVEVFMGPSGAIWVFGARSKRSPNKVHAGACQDLNFIPNRVMNVVRFVCVIRVPLCARVSRVCPVCVPAPPVSFDWVMKTLLTTSTHGRSK